MLKIVEVLVLIAAGILFIGWQFRDLRRAREITRKQREAQQAQAMNASTGSRHSDVEKGPHGNQS